MNGSEASELTKGPVMDDGPMTAGETTMLTIPARTPVLYTEVERYDVAQNVVKGLLVSLDALQAHVVLKHAVAVLETAMTLNKEAAITAMTEKDASIFGAKVQQRKMPGKWEYDDSTLRDLEDKKETATKAVKDRKTFLEKLKSEMADTATGEIVKPAKQLYPGGVTVAVTLPD